MRSLMFLVPIAVAIIAIIIVVLHRHKQRTKIFIKHQKPHLGGNEQEAIEEDDFSQELIAETGNINIDEGKDGPAQNPDEDSAGVIVMGVLARQGYTFAGYELLQALLSNGLRYGQMHIFHRHEEGNGHGAILFSLASATKPGTFELTKMGSFKCHGLSLFMRVSGQKDLQQALDIMINTAKQLAEDLDGEVVDEKRQPLSNEKIKFWRERVRTYEQGCHTADLFEQ